MRYKGKLALPLLVASAFAVTLLSGCNDDPNGDSGNGIYAEYYYAAGDVAKDYSALDNADPSASTGIKDLTGLDYDGKTEVLGALEKYAVDNALTGLPMFENGSYAIYQDRITKGTEEYITGYGFGILREGSIDTSVKIGQDNYPTYYHTYESSDPGTISYIDASDSQVSDLNSYIAGSFFDRKMNEEKNGYDWHGYLSSKDRPFLVKTDSEGNETVIDGSTLDPTIQGNTWRIYVRTGEEGGVKFHTGSDLTDRIAYEGQAVTLDDYVSAFKVLLNGKYAYYRGNELAGSTGSSTFVGADAYYEATANCDPWDDAAEAAWEDFSGVTSGTDGNGDYIQLTFGANVNCFYAMYYSSSTLYSPINMNFFKLVTNNGEDFDNWGHFSVDGNASPVDNILSVGPYYLSNWENDVQIVFTRNADWWESVADSNIYTIEGIYAKILTAVNTDSNKAFTEFLSGNLDACSIPQDYLQDYKNDSRARQTKGDAVFKLNVNSCTQDLWNELFGDNGSVAQTGDDSYECKPWMANDNFVKGLFYSLDRDTFGANHGYTPSIDYFAGAYLSNPEDGISYNTTAEHAAALADFWGDSVSTYGYNVNMAQTAFSAAIDELLKDGSIKDGDTLDIEIWWMYESDITSYGNEIESYFTSAFNNCSSAQKHNITLKVNQDADAVWSDVYYKHLLVGQFDLGFGSISGNTLDPLNFMEVLKSNNSSGFTLNWGKDTSQLDLEFEGETWSFDTLWGAADHGVALYRGIILPPFVFKLTSALYDADAASASFKCEYQDAESIMTELHEKDSTNSDAQTILDLIDDGSFYWLAAYFILCDDEEYEVYLDGPSWADGSYTVSGEEDTGFAGTTASWDEDSGVFSTTIEGESLELILEERGYLDIYCYGVSGWDTGTNSNSQTAYGIPEVVFDVE